MARIWRFRGVFVGISHCSPLHQVSYYMSPLIPISWLTRPSPYIDPVFFLHHTQLDRLWWKWQSSHPKRKLDYAGIASHGSHKKASVDDLLLMGGLARDIAVSQVLDTNGDLLCYQY